MNFKKLNRTIGIVLLGLFCIFLVLFEKISLKMDKNELGEHVEILKEALWNLNPEGPVNYLAIAAKQCNYQSIKVFAVEKEKPFIFIEGPENNFLDRMLIKAKLIPGIPMAEDIYHRDRKIGRIEVVHLHTTIYANFYVLLVMGLVWLTLGLFSQTIRAKQFLEEQVKQRTKELKTSAENLRITLNSIGDAVIATDLNGNIARMNPVAEDLTAWRSEEAAGKPLTKVFRIINTKTREPAVNPVEEVLEYGKIVGLVNHTMLLAKDGTEYLIADSAAPIKNKEGEVTGVVLVFRDVTKDYILQAKLKESEERLRTIFENEPECVKILNPDTTLVTMNPAGLSMIEAGSMGMVKGQSVLPIVDHPFREDFRELTNTVCQKGETGRLVFSMTGFKGTQRWMEIHAVPLRNSDGRITGLLGVTRDITEKMRAEEELRSLRSYLANIIDSMPSMLVGLDTKGHITQWNARAEQDTGIAAQNAMKQPLEQVMPRLTSEMTKIFKAMETRMVLTDTRQPTNGARYEDITIYPLIANGIDGAVIRIDDVTDKVRLEEMMVQSEKMLSVGGLAAGMAHEINNPLAGMMQTANVMNERLTRMDLEANVRAAREAGITMAGIKIFMEQRGILRMINAINESGQRVADIVDNMLSFARKSDASVSSHDPTELMDRILDLAATDYDLKKQYDFKTIKIIKEYEENLPKVPCEGAKIQQVVLNILRNGAQAMQAHMGDRKENTEDRAAALEAPCFILRLFHEQETSMLRIEVQDNGPGIDEKIRKRIFEPFFTSKPVGTGTGLGLSVSYFIIVENHGGTMDVVSEPGKGTTFIIRLPLKRNNG